MIACLVGWLRWLRWLLGLIGPSVGLVAAGTATALDATVSVLEDV